MVAPLHLPGSLTTSKLANQLRGGIFGRVLSHVLNFYLGSGTNPFGADIFFIIIYLFILLFDKTLQLCGYELV